MKVFLESLKLILVTVLLKTRICGSDQEIRTPVFRFGSWDFATILRTSAFVDKTLLAKELFKVNNMILTVSPSRSGKSTNLNMLKSFFEIFVDENGKPRDPEESPNYILFSENNLKIFSSDESFFYEHFGRFPVIFIDYKVFSGIDSYNKTIYLFREVLLNAFEQHEYLIHSSNLRKDEENENLYIKYSRSPEIFSLTENELKNGFLFLSKLLFKHFNKKVIVLVDNYDAFQDSSNLKINSDWGIIKSFIAEVNSKLFSRNNVLDRVLITSTLRQPLSKSSLNTENMLPTNIVEYNFCKYNQFCKYFGITSNELEELLSKFFTNSQEKERAKSRIKIKSSTLEQNIQIYNTWSVLHYIANINTSTVINKNG